MKASFSFFFFLHRGSTLIIKPVFTCLAENLPCATFKLVRVAIRGCQHNRLACKYSSKLSQGREAQGPSWDHGRAQPMLHGTGTSNADITQPCEDSGDPPAATWAHKQGPQEYKCCTSSKRQWLITQLYAMGVEMKSLLLASSLFSDN